MAELASIGVDIVRIAQLVHALSVSASFAGRVFSIAEWDSALKMPQSRAAEFLAGRFAVKEAVLKAMSVDRLDQVALHDIETLTAGNGSPRLRLSESALQIADSRNLTKWDVSISHDGGFAIAFVIAH